MRLCVDFLSDMLPALTRHYARSNSGRNRGFPLADMGQEGEEQAVPCHGKDDPRQREHGAQQTAAIRLERVIFLKKSSSGCLAKTDVER